MFSCHLKSRFPVESQRSKREFLTDLKNKDYSDTKFVMIDQKNGVHDMDIVRFSLTESSPAEMILFLKCQSKGRIQGDCKAIKISVSGTLYDLDPTASYSVSNYNGIFFFNYFSTFPMFFEMVTRSSFSES